ncbi:hypothetical protein OG339_47925 (plasmid) [Streptosporangium sp. NBC_01495]|uniref:hypothetical protein n=1 Tax=Streptosporangium sp. NBC_01495 TaxID=2903899 RepID=UPI002E331A33|nr:hypothetical protein [Streptosporangium sp. NBC_01495]
MIAQCRLARHPGQDLSVETDPALDLRAIAADRANRARQAADTARAEHLHYRVTAVTYLIRTSLPGAHEISVQLDAHMVDLCPRHHVGLIAIYDCDRTIWHRDDNRSRRPSFDVVALEEDLAAALSFGVTPDVLTQAGWRRDAEQGVWRIPLSGADPLAVPAQQDRLVWILKFDGGSHGYVVLHPSYKDAIRYLAIEVRERWYRVTDQQDATLPMTPPHSDQDAVEMFFRAVPDERYRLHAVTIPALVAATLTTTTVWILRHGTDARHDAEVTLYASEQEAIVALAAQIRSTWYRITDEDSIDVPATPPEEDGEAVRIYFKIRRKQESEEDYSLYDVRLPGPLADRWSWIIPSLNCANDLAVHC